MKKYIRRYIDSVWYNLLLDIVDAYMAKDKNMIHRKIKKAYIWIYLTPPPANKEGA